MIHLRAEENSNIKLRFFIKCLVNMIHLRAEEKIS